MRVGISAEWLGSRAGGLETYTSKLLDGLSRIRCPNDYRVFTLRSGLLGTVAAQSPNMQEVRVFGRSRWFAVPVGIPLAALRCKVDVLHATSVAPPFSGGQLVVTVHDLGFRKHPEFYPPLVRLRLAALIRAGVCRARQIIAISEATKRDLQEVYEIPDDRIRVVHNGVDDIYRPIADADEVARRLSRYGIPTPYVLYVGRHHPGKNLGRLLEAFKLVRRRGHDDLNLVLVGTGLYYEQAVYRRITELGIADYVVKPGYVDAADLPYIYNGARVFAYPSLFEGFGLPPLEAMRCGVPTLVSDTSSLPEIVGDGALQAQAYSVEDLTDKLEALLVDEQLRADLRQRGLARAATFTWERAALETAAAYRAALN